MKTAAKVSLVLFFLVSACRGPFSPSVPLERLLSSPLEVEVEGRILVLETFLWRDFMPGAPPGGSDLMAKISITAADQQPFPDGLDADRLWLIKAGDIWETEFANEEIPFDSAHSHQNQKIARGGPKWETGTRVEVVVRLLSQEGPSYLLRATHQLINRTL